MLAWKSNAASLHILQNMFTNGWKGDVDLHIDANKSGFSTVVLVKSRTVDAECSVSTTDAIVALLVNRGAAPLAKSCKDANVNGHDLGRQNLPNVCLRDLTCRRRRFGDPEYMAFISDPMAQNRGA
jgi:hypothetical protein